MTIKAYLDSHRKLNLRNADPSGPSWIDVIQESTSIWSNNACKGYLIKALNLYCKNNDAQFDKDEAQSLLYALSMVFDDISVEEAETFFEESYYW